MSSYKTWIYDAKYSNKIEANVNYWKQAADNCHWKHSLSSSNSDTSTSGKLVPQQESSIDSASAKSSNTGSSNGSSSSNNENNENGTIIPSANNFPNYFLDRDVIPY